VDRDDAQREAVDSALFARYAGADLDRWRTLVGGTVEHVDSRWGTGRVEDVRWSTSGHGVPPHVRVRVRYPNHGLAVYRAASFPTHHRSVTVEGTVRDIIRTCFESSCTDERREELLRTHSRALREAEDRRRLERVEQMKRHATKRKAEED